jgi:predicted RNA-binding protein
MCESKVVRVKGGEEEVEEVVMEDVVRVEVDGDLIRLYGLLGEYKEMKGKIVLMDMRSHRIVIAEG